MIVGLLGIWEFFVIVEIIRVFRVLQFNQPLFSIIKYERTHKVLGEILASEVEAIVYYR